MDELVRIAAEQLYEFGGWASYDPTREGPTGFTFSLRDQGVPSELIEATEGERKIKDKERNGQTRNSDGEVIDWRGWRALEIATAARNLGREKGWEYKPKKHKCFVDIERAINSGKFEKPKKE